MPKQNRISWGDVVNPSAEINSLASALLGAESVAELRTLRPLPRHAQELVDKAVTDVQLDRLTIFADVLAAGLTFNLPDPLSVMEVYWEKSNRVGHAQRTMLPDARGERQVPDLGEDAIPIYITMDDYSFNIRVLRASERIGAPLDTTMVQMATRNVNEAFEDAIIHGAGVTVRGNSTPGLLDAPNANTQAYVDNEPWDDAGHSGEDILKDVQNMASGLIASKFYPPYRLYIPTAYGVKLGDDFKANSDKTIRQRLLELDEIESIRVADRLPANRTVMLKMQSDVIDIIDGQRPTSISWEAPNGFRWFGAVMGIMVPRVKSNYDAGSGIMLGNLT